MSLGKDFKKFANKTGKSENVIVRSFVFEIGKAIVIRTPVGDPDFWIQEPPPGYTGGRTRANWQHSLDSPKENVLEIEDKSGSNTINNILSSIPKNAAGKVHYLTNNVDWIMALEEGTGSPRQAPNGMAEITIKEFEQILKRLVK